MTVKEAVISDLAAASGRNMYTILSGYQPFIIGGLSGMFATVCIHPIDMVKVRLQLAQNSAGPGPTTGALGTARSIITQGGFLDLYQGLSAGLLRQAVYGTARLGLFYTAEDMLKKRAAEQDKAITFGQRALAGVFAGGMGALIGNPTEVALIRMQSDGSRPADQRANYRSVFDALWRVTRKEGVRGLWSGAAPTMTRACATNFGQLTTFSEAKHQLSATDLTPQAQTIAASAIAGTFAAVFSLPFDFVKTRLQSQPVTGPEATPRYKGTFDCFLKVLRSEGPLAFYRGLIPYYLRITPHAMIMLTVADNMTRFITRSTQV